MGTRDSHLRALNRLQTFCSGMHALLDSSAAAGRGTQQGLWYQPSTWLGKLKRQEAEVQRSPCHSLPARPMPGAACCWGYRLADRALSSTQHLS